MRWPCIPQFIFHCNSPKGTGTRAAGWYLAELERRGITSSKVHVLVVGVIAWTEAYREREVENGL
jgi:hypothetical protein